MALSICPKEAGGNTPSTACPERRDLIHGDLLHGNVLVSPDARGLAITIAPHQMILSTSEAADVLAYHEHARRHPAAGLDQMVADAEEGVYRPLWSEHVLA